MIDRMNNHETRNLCSRVFESFDNENDRFKLHYEIKCYGDVLVFEVRQLDPILRLGKKYTSVPSFRRVKKTLKSMKERIISHQKGITI